MSVFNLEFDLLYYNDKNSQVRGQSIISEPHFSPEDMLKFLLSVWFSISVAEDFKVPKPTTTQAKWLDYEVGAIVHFNMQTFDRYMKPGRHFAGFFFEIT